MRIGMVTAVYKPVINGVTNMVALYKRQLEALGHEVTIFTLGDSAPEGDEPGVIRSPGISVGRQGYYLSARYNQQAQQKLREMDILHCHHLFMSVDMAHRYAHCPIVYTNHTRYDLYTGNFVPLPQPAADALMRQVWPEYTDMADVVITPSESVRQVMVEFGVRRPIVVIENGLDLQPFHEAMPGNWRARCGLPATAVVAIYVGRLAQEKNIAVLLQQFAIAQDILPDLHLLLAGHGPQAKEMAYLAQALGLADHIHFLGAVSYNDVPGLLATADFFVTASISEVHPLTVIEAMAVGLPVAATRSPGIVDTVVAGETGLLAGDPRDGLAAAMVGLGANPALRAEMATAARAASRRYDIRRTVALTLRLYERLRETRPDLQREKEHGRWYRNRRRLDPALEQLTRLVRPPDRIKSP